MTTRAGAWEPAQDTLNSYVLSSDYSKRILRDSGFVQLNVPAELRPLNFALGHFMYIVEFGMKDFLTTLANFSPAQLLASLAVLTPFVAGIWAAMKWAYGTRLHNLETELADFRADFERKMTHEVAKVTDAHKEEVEELKTAHMEEVEVLKTAHKEELETLKSEMEKLRSYVIPYLCEHPHLISELPVTKGLAEKLQQLIQDKDTNAMYVFGRMLISGRLFSDDGDLPRDKERGLTLIRTSAERGHSASIVFINERST